MKTINLGAIRIDGGTQSRVEIQMEAVQDYAAAIAAGAVFPPVVVFFDGTDHWLADGFHRMLGHQKAGKSSIEADVRTGTVRDAIRYSLGANDVHGLRRTNADKRKAVLLALNDDEWSMLPHRDIAAMCCVSREYVARLSAELAPSSKRSHDAKRMVTRGSVTYQQDTRDIGKAAKVARGKPEPAPKKDPEDVAYFGPSAEEIAEAEAAAADDLSLIHKLIEADDKLAAAVAENDKLRAELAVVKLSRDGYMNRSNELISRVKWLKKKLAQVEAAHV